MSEVNKIAHAKATVKITDDAVGVDRGNKTGETYWYVARTHTNRERKCQALLDGNGYETYLPQQEEEHTWSQGRKRKVHRMVLPGFIFVHCTNKERLQVFQLGGMQDYLAYWMTDSADKDERTGRRGLATIPDREMVEFRQVVEQALTPVTIEPCLLHPGDQIRVKSGALKGCTGELERLDNGTVRLAVRLAGLGAAKVSVELKDIELI